MTWLKMCQRGLLLMTHSLLLLIQHLLQAMHAPCLPCWTHKRLLCCSLQEGHGLLQGCHWLSKLVAQYALQRYCADQRQRHCAGGRLC